MTLSKSILLATLAAALALPVTSFAAKADGKGKKAQSPEETFATIDQDKDGFVTLAEYLKIMKRILGEDAAKARFAGMDKNSDGKLTKEEFVAGDDEPKTKRKRKNAN